MAFFFFFLNPSSVLFTFMVMLLACLHTQNKALRFLKQQSYAEALKPAGQDGISANALAVALLLYMKNKMVIFVTFLLPSKESFSLNPF